MGAFAAGNGRMAAGTLGRSVERELLPSVDQREGARERLAAGALGRCRGSVQWRALGLFVRVRPRRLDDLDLEIERIVEVVFRRRRAALPVRCLPAGGGSEALCISLECLGHLHRIGDDPIDLDHHVVHQVERVLEHVANQVGHGEAALARLILERALQVLRHAGLDQSVLALSVGHGPIALNTKSPRVARAVWSNVRRLAQRPSRALRARLRRFRSASACFLRRFTEGFM